MPLTHSRKPQDLSESEYGEFTSVLQQFLSDDRSLPNRPEHLVNEQLSAGTQYRAKLDAMNLALVNQKFASEAMLKNVDDIIDKLRWMRKILTTIGGENILIEFGLDKQIPTAYSEIKDYADVVSMHWQIVRSETRFLPVQSLCDELPILVDQYSTLRSAQITAMGEYQQSTEEKNDARATHNSVERNIFTWYCAFHPNPNEEWWAKTPWGKSGGSQGNKLPAPKNLIYDAPTVRLKWETVDRATFYVIEHKFANDTTYKEVARVVDNQWRMREPYIGVSNFRISAGASTDVGESCPPIEIVIHPLGAITNFRWEAFDETLRWDSVDGATCYLLLANDEPFGELIYTNSVHIAPDPEADLRMQVWGTNGTYATPRSSYVIIPRKS